MENPPTSDKMEPNEFARYALATIISLGNAIGGLMAILAAIGGRYFEAVAWIYFGFIADTVDGPVARRLNATSKFGAELDTICDIITFGVAPFVLLFVMNPFYLLLVFPYIFCAIIRLARFGAIESPPGRHLGLASPMAAIWVATTIGWALLLPLPIFNVIISVITLVSAVLMVTKRQYHKIVAASNRKLRIVDWILWLSTGLLVFLWWFFNYLAPLIVIVCVVTTTYAIFLGAPFLKWNAEE